MELGMGFLLGILGGAVISVFIAIIVAVSRKALGGGAKEPPPAGRATRRDDTAETRPTPQRDSGDTMIIEAVDSRDAILNKNIHEVRDMLLRLAEVVSGTDDASGRAQETFSTVRKNIDAIRTGGGDDLGEAQNILMLEIDRMLKTNALLHGELDRANKGIAEQRRQIEELQVRARIDGLTRIPNRSAFDERLREYIALQDRSKLTFSLLLLDIDHFKQINDEHGHISGDRILRGVAARISDSIRPNDFAARYGGEEFAVILPGTGLKDARMVAERARLNIAKTNFRLAGELIKLTVSGGLIESAPGSSQDSLVAQADRALYQAKSDGRNLLVVVEPEKGAPGTQG